MTSEEEDSGRRSLVAVASQLQPPPPQLVFDDGSRIMSEQPPTTVGVAAADHTKSSRSSHPSRGGGRSNNTSIHVYYEIDRLVQDIVNLLSSSSSRRRRSCCSNNQDNDDENNDNDDNNDNGWWSCRVALQFPDELLVDAPQVCWDMEEALCSKINNEETTDSNNDNAFPLVFILGDTTFGPCCPDEVSAMHLQADVLVHYGHACLSPTVSLPVLYSFGMTDMNVRTCVTKVLEEQVRRRRRQDQDDERNRNIVLLYEVRYYHAMKELERTLKERGGNDMRVVVGQIPKPCSTTTTHEGCSATTTNSSCDNGEDAVAAATETATTNSDSSTTTTTFVVGGLELPTDVDLSSFTVLFIGDDDDNTQSRQYVNTMLRFLSMPCGRGAPLHYWTYSPVSERLETTVPPALRRKLNRRFYLTQKARDSSVYGILVGTLSQRHFQSVVSSIQQVIQDAGKACYTFAVGKINGAKLANFGEVDCFVLVACSENSLLDDERNLHVPVITPLELDVALGNVEWGTYSLDYNDFLANKRQQQQQQDAGQRPLSNVTTTTGDDDDQDAPYFSLVSGTYVDSKRPPPSEQPVDLSVLPGKGQLATYKSEAANFLKNREYQGLQTNIGQDEAHSAIPGQTGIASNYGNR